MATITLSVQGDSIADAAFLAKVTAAITGAPVATVPPGQTPPPTQPPPPPLANFPPDTNVYPIKMTPPSTNGAPVTMGVGPDQIVVLASNFNTPPNQIAVIMDGMVIAAPLTVTGNAGMDKGTSQVFSIKGSWGPGPHKISIAPVPGGMNGVWINGITYNFVPYVFNGTDPQSDHAGPIVNALAVWDNMGVLLDFTPPIAVVPATPPPPPPPAAVPSTISAQVSGIAKTGTLDALVASVPAHGTLTLPAGTFLGTSAIGVACTVMGAGVDKTILDGTNLRPTHDKGALVPTVAGITISNMTIQNFAIAGSLGGNASAVREDGPGTGCMLINVKSTKNQNGLLTSGGNWTLTGCTFQNNGGGNPGSGATHEMYFNSDTNNVVRLTSTIGACGPMSTHALKSRAKTTLASLCTFTANSTDPTHGGNAGSVVDIPDSGVFTADHCVFNLPNGSANTNFLTYGEESGNNLPTGNHVALTNSVFADGTGTGGGISSSQPSATLDVTGSTYTGPVPPRISGWASVTGTVAKAA